MSKSKRKWNRASFFRRKKTTRRKVGHPAYIYQTRGRDYKYLTITHTPEKGKEELYEKLKHNIDPRETERSSYVKKRYAISRSDSFELPTTNYRIHPDDREIIKKYKK